MKNDVWIPFYTKQKLEFDFVVVCFLEYSSIFRIILKKKKHSTCV